MLFEIKEQGLPSIALLLPVILVILLSAESISLAI